MVDILVFECERSWGWSQVVSIKDYKIGIYHISAKQAVALNNKNNNIVGWVNVSWVEHFSLQTWATALLAQLMCLELNNISHCRLVSER